MYLTAVLSGNCSILIYYTIVSHILRHNNAKHTFCPPFRTHGDSIFTILTPTAFAPVPAPLHTASSPPLKKGLGISALSSRFLLTPGRAGPKLPLPFIFIPPMYASGRP
jgi:hypothetical protein